MLLRLLRKGETEAARQLWSDAWLDGKSAALVTRELQAIALGVNDDAGVRVRKGSRAEIQRCAAAWLAAPDAKAYERARAAALAGRVTAERIAGLIRAHGEGRSFVAAEARHPAAGGGQANGLSGALSNTTGSN